MSFFRAFFHNYFDLKVSTIENTNMM